MSIFPEVRPREAASSQPQRPEQGGNSHEDRWQLAFRKAVRFLEELREDDRSAEVSMAEASRRRALLKRVGFMPPHHAAARPASPGSSMVSLGRLCSKLRRKEYAKGDIVYDAGWETQRVYIVESGEIAICKCTDPDAEPPVVPCPQSRRGGSVPCGGARGSALNTGASATSAPTPASEGQQNSARVSVRRQCCGPGEAAKRAAHGPWSLPPSWCTVAVASPPQMLGLPAYLSGAGVFRERAVCQSARACVYSIPAREVLGHVSSMDLQKMTEGARVREAFIQHRFAVLAQLGSNGRTVLPPASASLHRARPKTGERRGSPGRPKSVYSVEGRIASIADGLAAANASMDVADAVEPLGADPVDQGAAAGREPGSPAWGRPGEDARQCGARGADSRLSTGLERLARCWHTPAAKPEEASPLAAGRTVTSRSLDAPHVPRLQPPVCIATDRQLEEVVRQMIKVHNKAALGPSALEWFDSLHLGRGSGTCSQPKKPETVVPPSIESDAAEESPCYSHVASDPTWAPLFRSTLPPLCLREAPARSGSANDVARSSDLPSARARGRRLKEFALPGAAEGMDSECTLGSSLAGDSGTPRRLRPTGERPHQFRTAGSTQGRELAEPGAAAEAIAAARPAGHDQQARSYGGDKEGEGHDATPGGVRDAGSGSPNGSVDSAGLKSWRREAEADGLSAARVCGSAGRGLAVAEPSHTALPQVVGGSACCAAGALPSGGGSGAAPKGSASDAADVEGPSDGAVDPAAEWRRFFSPSVLAAAERVKPAQEDAGVTLASAPALKLKHRSVDAELLFIPEEARSATRRILPRCDTRGMLRRVR